MYYTRPGGKVKVPPAFPGSNPDICTGISHICTHGIRRL